MLRSPLLIALLAGLVSATGFAPLGLWPLLLISLAVLAHLVMRAGSMKAALGLGWIFGVGHFTTGLNWIAHAFTFQDAMPHWFGYGAVILLSLYLAIYPAMAAGLAWRWGRSSPTTFSLIFGAAWIVTEWLRATMFTGFAWNPLGVVWVDIPAAAKLAALVGTYGLSGLTALLAAALAAPRVRGNIAILVALPLLALGAFFVPTSQPTHNGGARIRVVQPNIGQQDKHVATLDRLNNAKLAALSGHPGTHPRLIFWPEAAVPEFLEEERWARERLAKLLGPKDLLLTGGVALIAGNDGKVIGARNSLFVLDSEAQLLGRYDKAHLVPYGEYLPMRPLLSAIGFSRLVPGDIDFWSGPGPQTLNLDGFGAMGVQICYEIIFSGQVVDRANRPDFLFNPSNDAWFGAWGPPQHLAQARLRAVEEAIPVIRSTPTGISAVIDAEGRLLASLPHMTAGALETAMPAPHSPTPFARLGQILPFALAMILAGLGVALGRRRR